MFSCTNCNADRSRVLPVDPCPACGAMLPGAAPGPADSQDEESEEFDPGLTVADPVKQDLGLDGPSSTSESPLILGEADKKKRPEDSGSGKRSSAEAKVAGGETVSGEIGGAPETNPSAKASEKASGKGPRAKRTSTLDPEAQRKLVERLARLTKPPRSKPVQSPAPETVEPKAGEQPSQAENDVDSLDTTMDRPAYSAPPSAPVVPSGPVAVAQGVVSSAPVPAPPATSQPQSPSSPAPFAPSPFDGEIAETAPVEKFARASSPEYLTRSVVQPPPSFLAPSSPVPSSPAPSFPAPSFPAPSSPTPFSSAPPPAAHRPVTPQPPPSAPPMHSPPQAAASPVPPTAQVPVPQAAIPQAPAPYSPPPNSPSAMIPRPPSRAAMTPPTAEPQSPPPPAPEYGQETLPPEPPAIDDLALPSIADVPLDYAMPSNSTPPQGYAPPAAHSPPPPVGNVGSYPSAALDSLESEAATKAVPTPVWRDAHPSAQKWASKRGKPARAPKPALIAFGLLIAGVGAYLIAIFLPSRRPLDAQEVSRIATQAGETLEGWRFSDSLYDLATVNSGFIIFLGVGFVLHGAMQRQARAKRGMAKFTLVLLGFLVAASLSLVALLLKASLG